MILVCLGSTLAMLVSGELSAQSLGGQEAPVDPSRIAAGIVTGVGFLGAGVIVRLGDVVRGVTTAASIWFVAAIGIAVGSGYYALSVVATLLGIVILGLLRYPERYLKGHLYRVITVEMASTTAEEVLSATRTLVEDAGQTVLDVQGSRDIEAGTTSVQVYVRTRQDFRFQKVFDEVGKLTGVRKVSWLAPHK